MLGLQDHTLQRHSLCAKLIENHVFFVFLIGTGTSVGI